MNVVEEIQIRDPLQSSTWVQDRIKQRNIEQASPGKSLRLTIICVG